MAQIRTIARESPDGWGTFAEILRQDREAEPEALLEFLARNMGKDVLPLLRGLALDEDEELAHAALKALPLLGTRAAGEALVEAFAARPEGQRARLAWQGVQALQARGINVSVPEPASARPESGQYQLREMWQTLPDGVGSVETIGRLQDRYGVWHSLMVATNDRAGVKEGFMRPMSQREWEQIRTYQEGQGATLVRVPPEYARWHVDAMRALNQVTGFPLGEQLEAWDQIVGPAPEGYQPPDPTEPVRGMDPAERRRLADDIEGLFDIPTFENWAFEPADCRPWYDEWVGIVGESGAEPREEEQQALFARAARELATPEVLERYRDRMADAARQLEWLGWTEQARTAAVVTIELESERDPGEIALMRALVHNGLGMLLEILDEGEDPEALRYDPMQAVQAEDLEE